MNEGGDQVAKEDWERTSEVCLDCGYFKFRNKKTKQEACLNCEITIDFPPDLDPTDHHDPFYRE